MIKKYLNKFLSIFRLKVSTGNGYIAMYIHPPTKKMNDRENGVYKKERNEMLNKLLKRFNLKLVTRDEYEELQKYFIDGGFKVPLKDFKFDGEDDPHILSEHEEHKEPLSKVIKDHEIDTSLIDKEVKPHTSKKCRSMSLTILFSNGHTLSWKTKDLVEKTDFPYADFYKWYFCKTTPLYLFSHHEGETIFRRGDIVRIERSKSKNVK